MSRKGIAVAVAVWGVVVVLVSVLAWVAIDRAGRAVLADPVGAAPLVGTATTASPPPTSSSLPSGTTSAPPGPSSSSGTGRTGTATTHPGDVTAPGGGSTSGRPSPGSSSTSAHPGSTTTSRTSSPPSGPEPVDRSVQVAGGRVGVRCVGRTISLRFATPADGWRVEVEERGPEQVHAHFTASTGEGESEVEARCQGGTPVFTTSGDGDDDRAGR